MACKREWNCVSMLTFGRLSSFSFPVAAPRVTVKFLKLLNIQPMILVYCDWGMDPADPDALKKVQLFCRRHHPVFTEAFDGAGSKVSDNITSLPQPRQSGASRLPLTLLLRKNPYSVRAMVTLETWKAGEIAARRQSACHSSLLPFSTSVSMPLLGFFASLPRQVVRQVALRGGVMVRSCAESRDRAAPPKRRKECRFGETKK